MRGWREERQTYEEAELSDGEVACHDGLHALLPADAHPDVGRLDHAAVVGAWVDGDMDG